MAVEAGSFTGIMEADEVVVDYLVEMRGLDAAEVRSNIVQADAGATYCKTFDIDLGIGQKNICLFQKSVVALPRQALYFHFYRIT